MKKLGTVTAGRMSCNWNRSCAGLAGLELRDPAERDVDGPIVQAVGQGAVPAAHDADANARRGGFHLGHQLVEDQRLPDVRHVDHEDPPR
jgi:hypothetical protein